MSEAEFLGVDLGAGVSVIVVDAAPAGTPHGFVNSGAGRLRQVDIHENDHFVTDWLE